jgi:hypothetical protein
MNAPLRHAFTIDHLNTRLRSRVPLDESRRTQWLDALREVDGEALAAELVGPEEWLLIRDLHLHLRWREGAPDIDVTAQWRAALRQALAAAQAQPNRADIVRYAQRRAALADLFYRSALGDTTRQWAWQRMGLLARERVSPHEALGYGLRELLAAPELIWPILQRVIIGEADTASLSALLRALPKSDWMRLLRAAPQSAAYAQQMEAFDAAKRAAESAPSQEAAPAIATMNAQASALIDWATARAAFCAPYIEVLSILVAALDAASQGQSPLQAWHRLSSAQHRLASVLAPYARSAQSPASTRRAEIPPRNDTLSALPALPEPPLAEAWLPTQWAGALFWLARVPASGLLDWHAQRAEADVTTPPLGSVLRELGRALGIADDDAALRAFCGGAEPDRNVLEFVALRESVAAVVAAWSNWLDDYAPDLAPPRLDTVCRRGGRLRFEPGWIELRLPLNAIDTSVRRLGLDLDPGWLPWLGCVVRIVYDE